MSDETPCAVLAWSSLAAARGARAGRRPRRLRRRRRLGRARRRAGRVVRARLDAASRLGRHRPSLRPVADRSSSCSNTLPGQEPAARLDRALALGPGRRLRARRPARARPDSTLVVALTGLNERLRRARPAAGTTQALEGAAREGARAPPSTETIDGWTAVAPKQASIDALKQARGTAARSPTSRPTRTRREAPLRRALAQGATSTARAESSTGRRHAGAGSLDGRRRR